MRVTGAKAHSCPRLVNARSSRSACQPPVEPMTAARMRANLAGRAARSFASDVASVSALIAAVVPPPDVG